jgi:hypothetical protein
VLEQVKSSDVRVYAVYVPILRGDIEATVPAAMEKLPDSRVVFFWDSKGEMSESYAAVLQLPKGRPAWDVYLAFNRAAEWKGESPTPSYWMHQLGDVSPDRQLDGQKFAEETNKLLEEKPK